MDHIQKSENIKMNIPRLNKKMVYVFIDFIE